MSRETDWSNTSTTEQYFLKAFRLGKQDHKAIIALSKFYPDAFSRAKKAWGKMNSIRDSDDDSVPTPDPYAPDSDTCEPRDDIPW